MKMTSPLKSILIAGASAVVLAGCGGDNNYSPPPTSTVPPPPLPPPPPPPPPPPTSASPQEQAGSGFAAAFNQAALDEPVEPVSGDIIPLDKTAEPIDIPDP